MLNSCFEVVAALTSEGIWPFRRWTAEICDPANPLAGLTASARTANGARRALAADVATALVDDRVCALPDEVTVEVVTMQSGSYEIPLVPLEPLG